jgi:hypothetical protein
MVPGGFSILCGSYTVRRGSFMPPPTAAKASAGGVNELRSSWSPLPLDGMPGALPPV